MIFNRFDKKILSLVLEKPILIQKINKISNLVSIDLKDLINNFEKLNVNLDEKVFWGNIYNFANFKDFY